MAEEAQPTPEGREGVDWMLAYQAGSEVAFERIVQAYSPRIYALCTRFLGPIREREDLVQEVFLRVIRARHRYRPSARLSTWLYRITYNSALNWLQSRRARGHGAEDAGPDGELEDLRDPAAHPPADSMERDDVVREVRGAIARLPDQQRLALILARYHEMSLAEIGQVLGCSGKAVKSLLHRARENLRKQLAHYLPEEAR